MKWVVKPKETLSFSDSHEVVVDDLDNAEIVAIYVNEVYGYLQCWVEIFMPSKSHRSASCVPVSLLIEISERMLLASRI